MGEAPPEGEHKDANQLHSNNDDNASKMNGISKATSQNEGRTRRRPFASAFGKRMRLFFSPWKWRRKTKRGLDKPPGPSRTLSGVFR